MTRPKNFLQDFFHPRCKLAVLLAFIALLSLIMACSQFFFYCAIKANQLFFCTRSGSMNSKINPPIKANFHNSTNKKDVFFSDIFFLIKFLSFFFSLYFQPWAIWAAFSAHKDDMKKQRSRYSLPWNIDRIWRMFIIICKYLILAKKSSVVTRLSFVFAYHKCSMDRASVRVCSNIKSIHRKYLLWTYSKIHSDWNGIAWFCL